MQDPHYVERTCGDLPSSVHDSPNLSRETLKASWPSEALDYLGFSAVKTTIL
jgi:hypothetical protein